MLNYYNGYFVVLVSLKIDVFIVSVVVDLFLES